MRSGWDDAAATVPTTPTVLALDGPAFLDWDTVAGGLAKALAERGVAVRQVDMTAHFRTWGEILQLTEPAGAAERVDDPDFATIARCTLRDFLRLPDPAPAADDGVTIVYGPGAGLVPHDLLWYADLPKRYAEAAMHAGRARNLGQPATAGPGTTCRLFYIDWPVLDRHRDRIAGRIDRWIDLQPDPVTGAEPTSLDGAALRATIRTLAGRPFRVRPFFNSTPWGGHWAQRELGFNPEAPNTALGYELIAPENGVLIGEPNAARIEVPFQMMVSLLPEQILGPPVQAAFGTSFPIRFDYLDTIDGGHLSVHCHPRLNYMRQVFGWDYTQHETYYVMIGSPGSQVFLGLRDDVDLDEFHRQALAAYRDGAPFEVTDHVQTHPADPHQLFLIPAGTPHASGVGNLVLEISATPYLYSLRFYDWLRQDAAGRRRPVHIEHAFANLDTARRGRSVRDDLVPAPRLLRSGVGWQEELLGDLPDVFYQVRRFVLDGGQPANDDTVDRFHVLNVVEGPGVVVRTGAGDEHLLAYAETLVIPAAVGQYTLTRIGKERVQVVKSLVR
ncbi:class I mannose-6-phosphate isomerase [Micromonospora yasonensis]|uniref:class I mannose-6-phosphate isomerase n=1 Tax=Micromonospora yasonensis TaxID=1128667 RepID=UPI002230C0C4|nr:class I mannose-6-phosphate isomerase [Micromonospora yasonensis]MCW3844665.1 class I mannose-6-phosphate isomerase [Micromonospora yasonensis]